MLVKLLTGKYLCQKIDSGNASIEVAYNSVKCMHYLAFACNKENCQTSCGVNEKASKAYIELQQKFKGEITC